MKVRKMTNFVRIRSKNETANALRGVIPTNGKNVILRLGSKTPTDQITRKRVDLEMNTPEACITSNNKISMKKKFDEAGIKTAEWKQLCNELVWDFYPAIIKHKHSCRGEGIYYIEDAEQLSDFIINNQKDLTSYIIEKYYTYSREYRLHVTKDGCFYSCRKMLKRDAEERWHRHDNNSVWILPENPLFATPDNFGDIVDECVKAMQAVGLDICAVDVKTQSKESPDFIILETNSAPSLGEIGVQKYIKKLTEIVEEI